MMRITGGPPSRDLSLFSFFGLFFVYWPRKEEEEKNTEAFKIGLTIHSVDETS